MKKSRIKFQMRKVIQTTSILIMLSSLFVATSCDEIDELLGLEDEEEVDDYDYGNSSSNTNGAYTYTYNCPYSGEKSIQIPAGSAKCQKAQEYFARTYACNDVDNFNTANCRVCSDCESQYWKNYCSLCE